MKEIPESQITFEIFCHPEDAPVKGNALASGDDAEDHKAEQDIIRRLEYTPWAWCLVEVRGTWKGLTASDFLGFVPMRMKTISRPADIMTT